MKKLWIAVVAAGVCAAAHAQADSSAARGFPSKPVKLVAPYAPGGAADVLARSVAHHLSEVLKETVIVENKPGANTQVAASFVARAPADGHTLLLASNASMVLNPLLYKKLSYQPEKDFKLTNILVEAPLVLVTNDKTQMQTLAGVKAYAQQNAGKLNYGSVGLGNPLQLTTELLKSRVGFEATHIPFNGSAPALTALIANETQLFVDIVGTSLPHIQSGKLKPIVTLGAERSTFLPDVPTAAESGVPGFKASTWFGIAMPQATPAEVRLKIQNAVNAVMEKKEFAEAAQKMFFAPQKPQSQAQIDQFLASDSAMWQKVIQDNRIQLDN